MFSSKKYELVKALHESDIGYRTSNDYFNDYDNNIGECFEKYFVAGCRYENKKIQIPCFGCQTFYRSPEQYYLTKALDLHNNKTIGFIVISEHGFRFWHVHPNKADAIAEACEHFGTLPIHIKDTTCTSCINCNCCL